MDRKILLQNLADSLADRTGITKRKAEAFVRSFFEITEEGLLAEGVVKVKGFGTTKVVNVNGRESVNINTGERFQIEGHAKVTFTPDTPFRDLVNRPFAHFSTVVLDDDIDLEALNAIDALAPLTQDDAEEDFEGQEPEAEDSEATLLLLEEPKEKAEMPEAEEEKTKAEEEKPEAEEETTEAEEETPEAEEETPEAGEETPEAEEETPEAEEETPEAEEETTEAEEETPEAVEETPEAEEETPEAEEETPEAEEETTEAEEEKPEAEEETPEAEEETTEAEEETTEAEEETTEAEEETLEAEETPEVTTSNNEEQAPEDMQPIIIQNTVPTPPANNWWRIAFFTLIAILLAVASYFAGYYRVFCPCSQNENAAQTAPTQAAAGTRCPAAAQPAPAADEAASAAVDTPAEEAHPAPDAEAQTPAEVQPQADPAPQQQGPTAAELAAAKKYEQFDGDYLITGVLKIHEMAVGDNLYKLAKANYGNKDHARYIILHNHFDNPDLLTIGQKIEIPRLTHK